MTLLMTRRARLSSPSRNPGLHGAYERIGEALRAHGYATVRVSFARPGDLRSGVCDVLGALARCGEHVMGRDSAGWSFGGAVVLAAGAGHRPRGGRGRARSRRAASCSWHGTAYRLLPPSVSQSLYRAAGHPKQLVLLDGAGHDIAGHEAEFERLVVACALPLLRSGSGGGRAGAA